MAKSLERWTVMPHGPLEQIDDGILTVAGEIAMPLGRFPRRMTVIRLTGEQTLVWSAIALAEPEMVRIEAMGRPNFLVVPSDTHRLDAKIWKQRYPDMTVVTASGARAGVNEVVPVDATGNCWNDPAVRFESVAGTDGREGALIVRRGDGASLIVNDVIGHVRHPHGLGAQLMARLMGFGVSGPRVPWPVKRKIVRDTKALGEQFRSWADEPALRRIIVSHADPIETDPAGVLRMLAQGLGA